MSCFLISCHARSERTRERECVVGRLSVSWGRWVFSLQRSKREEKRRTFVPGDRRKVPRKYERKSALGFSLCKHPALGSRRSCFSTAPRASSFCPLSRDCAIERVREGEQGSSRVTRCAALCALLLFSVLLLLFPASPLDLRGGLFAICWLLGICWQFRKRDG